MHRGLFRALHYTGRRGDRFCRFAQKRKPPYGGFLIFEDAKVGLLVSFFWLFFRYATSRPHIYIQARICSCIGLPGIALLILSEFLKNVPVAPPIGFRFSLLLKVLPLASTAPNTGGGSDLHSQGGCQQANLLALRLSPHHAIYSCSTKKQNVFNATIRRPKTNPNSTRYIAYLSSSKFGSPNEENLSGNAQIRWRSSESCADDALPPFQPVSLLGGNSTRNPSPVALEKENGVRPNCDPLFSWRRGWDSARFASRAPCQHAATRLRWSNRVRKPIPSRQKCKRPHAGPLTFWRCSESSVEDALCTSDPISRLHGKI